MYTFLSLTQCLRFGAQNRLKQVIEHALIAGNDVNRVTADAVDNTGKVQGNAQTIIDVIEQRGDLCRYALQPVSGKKHQLRLHMAALGAPICNDALYPVVNDAIADDYEKPLQLLASDVTFVDPLSGTPRYFKSELRLDW